ncbi:MAG: transcriptional repressor LexA [Candidatus Eisenbacteria bacterium]|nr:transcriptional repressor LexA [Candidatus Eisenbacteria bacterium]
MGMKDRDRVKLERPRGGRKLGKGQGAGKRAQAGQRATGCLGARAGKILDFIVNSILEKGSPPTIREIGKEFRISSTNGVRYYLGVLEKAGCIKRKGKISRGIEVKREWIDSARGESWRFVLGRVQGGRIDKAREISPSSPLGLLRPLGLPGLVEVPLVGRVAAGTPVLAEENIEDVITVDGSIAKPGKLFALRVRGDSMKNAGLLDGDIAIVRQQPRADSGDIVVALLGEEATVKKYVLKENEVILEPENESYEPIVVTEESQFSLVGKVIGSLRRY